MTTHLYCERVMSGYVAWVGQPDVIMLENVEEFQQWGLLDKHGKPIRDGACFKAWVSSLRALGYDVEWRELRACDYGTPTTRKRLFVVARCDGKPIIWPEKTHGAECASSGAAGSEKKPRRHHFVEIDSEQPDRSGIRGRRSTTRTLEPYRTAADIIDWSIPMCSIFATPDEAKAWARSRGVPTARRPLADNTMARIARGLVRYVIQAQRPFLVPYHREREGQAPRVRDLEDPVATVATAPMGVVDARLAKADRSERVAALIAKHNGSVTGHRPDRPLGSVTGVDSHAVAAAYLAKNSNTSSNGACVNAADEPLRTVTSCHDQQLVAACLSRASNSDVTWGAGDRSRAADEPMRTVTGRHDEQLVAVNLSQMYSSNRGSNGDPRQPHPTVTANGNHASLVASFLTKYYGQGGQHQRCDRPLDTVVGVERFGLVTVMLNGEPWVVVDIAVRMLTPRELARAQGFRDDYAIDRTADGRRLSKRTQVRLIGNSVCRHVARALVAANVVGVCDWASDRTLEAVA
jgi:DNA (cytosine-5)-methyltransferase 1